MLVTDSAEARFDFAARKDLYTAYLPYAVAAGAAALWAQKYQAATGTIAPQPDWYHSSTGSNYHSFSDSSGAPSFDSFESALSSSIAWKSPDDSSHSSAGGGGRLTLTCAGRRGGGTGTGSGRSAGIGLAVGPRGTAIGFGGR